MLVCSYCLNAIQSHEGNQIHRKVGYFERDEFEDSIFEDENGEELFRCEWCDDDTPVDEMYEI